MENFNITAYIINKKKDEDLSHIRSEFADKSEFDTVIVDIIEHSVQSIGLWKSLVQAVSMANEKDEDVIALCQDNHCFTSNYDKDQFFDTIIKAHSLSTHLLLGGVHGGFSNIVVVDKQLLWLDNFWGTQFMVIYQSLYQDILDATFDETDVIDKKLSELSTNKLLMYPMISTYHETGLRHTTTINAIPNYIHHAFEAANAKLNRLYQKYFFLKGHQ